MNKKVLMKILFPLLPAIAIWLASTDNSVTVLDSVAGTVETYSYFSVLPVEKLQVCTVLAALLAIAALVLALIHVAFGKRWCVRGVFYASCASMFASACPALIRGEAVVVPNVLFPILMGVLCLLAYGAGKTPKEEEAVFGSGRRL